MRKGSSGSANQRRCRQVSQREVEVRLRDGDVDDDDQVDDGGGGDEEVDES